MTVRIIPGADPLDLGELERVVSAAAVRVGIDKLFVGISQARTHLNVAALTGAGLSAAAETADGTVNDVLNSVTTLVGQTGPLVAQADALLGAISQYSVLMNDLTVQIVTLAESIRSVPITLGNLRGGLALADSGLTATEAQLQNTAGIRAEVTRMLGPVAAMLRAVGNPDGIRMADQLAVIEGLLGSLDGLQAQVSAGGLQLGAQTMNGQLQDLSPLLGQPVTDDTELVAVLDLVVARLQGIQSFLAQGDSTIKQVMTQLDQAKAIVPELEPKIRSQLDQLKAVTTQLTKSLDAATVNMPNTSAGAAASLSQTGTSVAEQAGWSLNAVKVLRAVILLLLGAAAIAIVLGDYRRRTATGDRDRVELIPIIVASVAVAGAVSIYTDHTNGWIVVPCLLAMFAAVPAYHAMARWFGGYGYLMILATIAGTVAIDLGVDATDPTAMLYIGSHVTDLLRAVMTERTDWAMWLPILVLASVGVLALAAQAIDRRWLDRESTGSANVGL
ncbi:hypothetical protein ACFV24_21855 [Nocardia fluminea]